MWKRKLSVRNVSPASLYPPQIPRRMIKWLIQCSIICYLCVLLTKSQEGPHGLLECYALLFGKAVTSDRQPSPSYYHCLSLLWTCPVIPDTAQCFGNKISFFLGCAMDLTVGHRPFIAETRDQNQAIPCGINGGRNCTGACSAHSSSVFLCHYHSTNDLQSSFITCAMCVSNCKRR
jgi:hypothetical protein